MGMQNFAVSKDKKIAYHLGNLWFPLPESKDLTYKELKMIVLQGIVQCSSNNVPSVGTRAFDDVVVASSDLVSGYIWKWIGCPFHTVCEDTPLYPEFLSARILASVQNNSLFVNKELGEVIHTRAQDRRAFMGADEP